MTSSVADRIRLALSAPTNGIVGMAHDLLSICHDNAVIIRWESTGVQVETAEGGETRTLTVPLRKSVFRSVLARLVMLCNETRLGSITPYGGISEIIVPGTPDSHYCISITNTPDEQVIELTPVSHTSPSLAEVID